jgi:8-oxo-dGTP pyrophosphatase MutT (NUDIX family)
MQQTEIVLVVVQRGGLICLARRSALVATSQGLWSVVTGYVENAVDPLDQAWAELEEELGLRAPDLQLRGHLPAVSLTSPPSGKRFLVHPFLFEATSDGAVVLNWEHDAVEWVEPVRLDDPHCVPWQSAVVRALLQRWP